MITNKWLAAWFAAHGVDNSDVKISDLVRLCRILANDDDISLMKTARDILKDYSALA